MMVTFVSQCEKNALKKTRRVLDAFANRIGDNTWQTIITNEGLSAVKKLLRKTASKSTAVSCHWIRTRSRSELMWIVGRRDKFNGQGVVPTNKTSSRLNHRQENDWQYLPLIQSLTAVAALFHDWGKATALFQQKLTPNNNNGFKGDPIRHEWISCLLLSAFIKQGEYCSDEDWLTRLSHGDIDEASIKSSLSQVTLQISVNPFDGLPMLAKLVAWLIVSHHRLPNLPKAKNEKQSNRYSANNYGDERRETLDELLALISKEWGYQNKVDEAEYNARLSHCFNFNQGLLTQSSKWLQQLQKWAQKLLAQQHNAQMALDNGGYRVVLHHARLSLMLGDHFYSSQGAANNWPDITGLFANTDRETNRLKQKLDEHLVGVAKHALKNAYNLPAFETELPVATDINSLKKMSPKAYRWQDKAVDKIAQWRGSHKHEKYGFFAVNMASTGCGKTFANAKIMRALSKDADSLRFTLALGLRTLTLQTGDEYRERIGLENDELAVLIGSSAVLELHNKQRQQPKELKLPDFGSESEERLLDEDIDFDCDIPEEGMATVLTSDRDRKFLYAPVLSCTIDHLMAATECVRGGKYILPSLRLMSADLVIDEIDDFSGEDLVAIGRLIFFTGMMGRKVMISSATIPPYLAEGYFKAYRDGWRLYAASRNAPNLIGCAWVDEFNTHVISNNASEVSNSIRDYREQHAIFIDKRVTELAKETAKRKVRIIDSQCIINQHKSLPVNDEITETTKQQAYFEVMAQSALTMHGQHNTLDKKTQLKVSFGVMRVANISPCVSLAHYLLTEFVCPTDTEIRVMPYHSQQVLLLRSHQEQHLDAVLKRKEENDEPPLAFSQPIIRQHLTNISRNQSIKQILFILVATPVEEVGRDHDFDWAVIEPSSYRSIVQLAGRVRRHRAGEISTPNISLMQHNLRGVIKAHQPEFPVFLRPGFETKELSLHSHDMKALVNEEGLLQKLDAVPRIKMEGKHSAVQFRKLKDAESLAELEHASIWRLVANYCSKKTDLIKESDVQKGPSKFQGYLRESWWLTGLPQTFFRFRKSDESLKVYLTYLPEQEDVVFCEKNDDGWLVARQIPLGISVESLTEQASQRLWLTRNYRQLIENIAEDEETSLRRISLRYGELDFRYKEDCSYVYNDQLGLVKK